VFHSHRIVRRISAPARSGGFSLIEILVVIALIGIVATLVIRNVAGGFGSGQSKTAKAQIASVGMSVEQYYVDNGSYPEKLEDLVSKPGNAANWMGPYAKPSQLSDPWGTPLDYRVPGENGRDFDLVSLGKDKRPGGEGANKDLTSFE
jgi:general secretion pathway protein G